jgi:hypothetical protein
MVADAACVPGTAVNGIAADGSDTTWKKKKDGNILSGASCRAPTSCSAVIALAALWAASAFV